MIADDLLLCRAVLLYLVPLVLHLYLVDQLHRSSQEVLSGRALLVHLVLLDHHLNPVLNSHKKGPARVRRILGKNLIVIIVLSLLIVPTDSLRLANYTNRTFFPGGPLLPGIPGSPGSPGVPDRPYSSVKL